MKKRQRSENEPTVGPIEPTLEGNEPTELSGRQPLFYLCYLCASVAILPFIGGAMTPVPRTTKNTKRTWISINRSESKRYEEIMTRGRLSAVASTGGSKSVPR